MGGYTYVCIYSFLASGSWETCSIARFLREPYEFRPDARKRRRWRATSRQPPGTSRTTNRLEPRPSRTTGREQPGTSGTKDITLLADRTGHLTQSEAKSKQALFLKVVSVPVRDVRDVRDVPDNSGPPGTMSRAKYGDVNPPTSCPRI